MPLIKTIFKQYSRGSGQYVRKANDFPLCLWCHLFGPQAVFLGKCSKHFLFCFFLFPNLDHKRMASSPHVGFVKWCHHRSKCLTISSIDTAPYRGLRLDATRQIHPLITFLSVLAFSPLHKVSASFFSLKYFT